jgi:hypothetical protein
MIIDNYYVKDERRLLGERAMQRIPNRADPVFDRNDYRTLYRENIVVKVDCLLPGREVKTGLLRIACEHIFQLSLMIQVSWIDVTKMLLLPVRRGGLKAVKHVRQALRQRPKTTDPAA